MIFNLPPICGLFPLLLYIVLSFRKGMIPSSTSASVPLSARFWSSSPWAASAP